jgi:hypothetical protein
MQGSPEQFILLSVRLRHIQSIHESALRRTRHQSVISPLRERIRLPDQRVQTPGQGGTHYYYLIARRNTPGAYRAVCGGVERDVLRKDTRAYRSRIC